MYNCHIIGLVYIAKFLLRRLQLNIEKSGIPWIICTLIS